MILLYCLDFGILGILGCRIDRKANISTRQLYIAQYQKSAFTARQESGEYRNNGEREVPNRIPY